MKFLGLDGKEHHLDTRRTAFPMRSQAGCASKIQYECGQVLKRTFPNQVILEEVTLPRHGLRFDFFLPVLGIVVEINGEQHKEYNTFFYKSKREFLNAKARDSDKATLCEMNNWTLYSVESREDLELLLC